MVAQAIESLLEVLVVLPSGYFHLMSGFQEDEEKCLYHLVWWGHDISQKLV